MKKLQRINKDNYQKTGNEIQDNLTQDDINLLLEEYTEIENINELIIGQHIRYYIIKKDNKGNEHKLFRMGGNIIKIDIDKKYVVLSNKRITWSVQLDNTIIYKKMTSQDIKEFYENELDNKEIEIDKYKTSINKLKKLLKETLEDNEKLKKNCKK